MTKLICKCCGGNIDISTGKCPYCDTQYIIEGSYVPKEPSYAMNIDISGLLTPNEMRKILGLKPIYHNKLKEVLNVSN